jgi:hypothetical protein
MRASIRNLLRAAAVGVVATSAAAAQLPNASAAAFGMGGNYTAMARGYEAVAWNAANLAMPGRPFISFGTAIIGGSTGLAPVDFTMLHDFSGIDVDSATKVAWINKAKLAGGETLRLDGGLTMFGLSVGPVGLQVGQQLYSSMNLSPDAFEALLFGNAGNNGGQPKTLDFTGTHVRAGAFSTGALSFALPIPINITNGFLFNEHLAIGVTGKYVVGHGMLLAQDLGSSFSAGNTQLGTVSFPVILPDTSSKGVAGSGAGADLSVAWSGGPWKVGVLSENVFNSFKWDTTKFKYRPGTGTIDQGSGKTDFDEQPYANAPQVLRDLVAKQAFKPAITIGAAFQIMPKLTLTADLKTSTGGDEAIAFGPKSRVGVGAEWRPLSFLPLRAGIASVTDGWQAGAGLGLRLFGYELGVSTSIRKRGEASESGLMIGLVGIGH